MNDNVYNIPDVDSVEATLVPITDIKHFVVDPVTGERTEVEAPVFGDVQAGEGEVATEYATI